MKICWGFSASFCTLAHIFPILEKIAADKENELIPVCSRAFSSIDTRFGTSSRITSKIESICSRKMINTLEDAEPIGPVLSPDIMVIAPTTGNTLSKIRNGIYDTPVTLGAKAHLRSGRPLLIAFASNDGLSANFMTIAEMFNRKNVFFVPMKQDDTVRKPYSLVADFGLIPECLSLASQGKQLLPLFIS